MSFGPKLVVAFGISLFLSSFLISYFALNMFGVGLADTVELPNQMQLYSSHQDFKNGQYNMSTLSKTGNTAWVYSAGTGMVLSSLGSYQNWFLIDNIQKRTDNKIVNSYTLKNIPGQDYEIALRYTNGADSNSIQVKADGFHIPDYFQVGGVQIGDYDFIPYPGANQIEDVQITTEYVDGVQNCPFMSPCVHTQEPNLVLTFNGQSYTTKKLHYPDNPLEIDEVYYGGVKSDTLGFTISDFRTNNIIQETSDVGTTTAILALIDAMGKILRWGLPDYIMPTMLQVLLILPQEFGLLVGLYCLVRGI